MSLFSSAIQRGTRSAQPAATTVVVGTLYCVTDESNKVERSNGTTWDGYSNTGPGTGTVTTTGSPVAGQIAQFSGATSITGVSVGFDLIAENLLAVDTASISFTSIPATFRHLYLVCYGRLTEPVTDDYCYLQFNADTGANYDFQQLTGSSTTVAGAASYGQTKIRLGEFAGASSSSANQPGVINISIPHYAGTTFNKMVLANAVAFWGTAGTTVVDGQWGGMWRNTAAITRIDLLPTANNFKAGSLFSLYGLK